MPLQIKYDRFNVHLISVMKNVTVLVCTFNVMKNITVLTYMTSQLYKIGHFNVDVDLHYYEHQVLDYTAKTLQNAIWINYKMNTQQLMQSNIELIAKMQ